MSTATRLHVSAPPPGAGALSHDKERVGGWVASRLPLLEAMLEGAVADLGVELREVRTAVDLAVGTRGRGGRRWRPLLTLAAAEACGGDCNRVLGVAAAVELTHTASLILDDLPSMDDAPTRRGFPSTHAILGPGTAILVAMGLLGRASELLARSPVGSAGIVAAWGEAFGLRGMAGGQAVDLTGKGCSFLAARRRLHRRKTTALSAFALGAGARAAGAPDQGVRCLERYGRDLGWAYQLMDDAADAGEDLVLGRPAGGRRPARQSGILVRRAMGELRACPTLAPEGRDLLLSFARVVVPDASPALVKGGRRPVAVTPLHGEGAMRSASRGGRTASSLNGNA